MVRRGAPALGVLVAALVALVAGSAGPASAGGGRLAPVQDRYEPGQTATLVGYTGGPAAAVAGEPFYSYLRPAGEASGAGLLSSDVYVGELVTEETGRGGYLQLRVSLTFDVPEDLVPGEYEVIHCDDPCSERRLGDLVASSLSIGVEPARRVIREWPRDEREVVNLPPAALLVGPDYQITAGELRAGFARSAPRPAPAVVPTLPAAEAPPGPAPVPSPPSDDMAWPLPTALVLGSAAVTGLVLSRRRPAPAAPPTGAPRAAPAGRRTDAASGGRG